MIQQERDELKVNFDDENIEKEMGFEEFYESEESQESPIILNLEHYYENQTAFEELLYHLYPQLDLDTPLAQKIHSYLQKAKNPLLENKRKQIEDLYKQLTANRTTKLIKEGELLGQERCKDILKQEVTNLEEIARGSENERQNKQLRAKIQATYSKIVELEEEIKGMAQSPQVSVDRESLTSLSKERQVYSQLVARFNANKQNYQAKSKVLKSLESQIKRPKQHLKDGTVEQVSINVRTKVVVQRQPEPEVKLMEKFEVLDVNPPNRVCWVLLGLLVLIHIFWRMAMS